MEELIQALRALPKHEQEQAERILGSVLHCFQDDTAHGIWVFTTDTSESVAVLTTNCDETDVAQMLGVLDAVLNLRLMADAPPLSERH